MQKIDSPGTGKDRRSLPLLLGAVFAVVFVFTHLSPLVTDDYTYSFSLSTGLRVDSLYEVFKSMELHRSEINGRYFSHVFTYIFLWKPKICFDVINGLMSAALVWIVSRYVRLTKPRSVSSVTLLWIALFFVLVPVFGQLFLWLDGSCNYSWAQVFVLLYLLPFCAAWLRQPLRLSPAVWALLVAEAFVAGSYSENASLAVLMISFLLLCALRVRKERLPLPLLLLFVSACGGFLFLFLSPMQTNGSRGSLSLSSAFARLGALLGKVPVWVLAGGLLALAVLALGTVLLRRRRNALFGFLQLCGAAAFLVLLVLTAPELREMSVLSMIRAAVSCSEWNVITAGYLFCAVWLLALQRRADPDMLVLGALFFAAALASVAVFLFAAYLPARSFAPYTTLLTLGIILLLSSLARQDRTLRRPLGRTAWVLLAVFALCLVLATDDIFFIHRTYDEQVSILKQVQADGSGTAYIPGFYPRTKYTAPYGLDPLQDYPDSWPNSTIAEYYGIAQVISLD